MTAPAITVDNLSKMYRLGSQGRRAESFRDAITAAVLAPFRRMKQLSGRDDTMEEFWALRNVSFEVQPGEVVGVIGRNGAGKSTLLKVLSRIVEPTEGRAVLRGRIASLLEVGTGFHPELTGRENIYMNGSILGMKRREIAAKFDEIVAFAEVDRFLDTPVKRYSSGMYVRLAFAVAAHLDPEILIVDEVLAVGDAEFQKKCLGKMKQVATGTGRTVIFVSHNMAAVGTLCQSAIVLSKGQVAYTGSTAKAVDMYLAQGNRGGLLSVTPARPPRAGAWMEHAEIRANNEGRETIRMGDELDIHVNYSAESAIARPRLGWVISDSYGNKLLCANNRYMQTDKVQDAGKSGRIVAKLGQVPLMPGQYHLSLYLGDESRDTHVLTEAIAFDIEPYDLWGQGKLPPQGAAAMWWPTTFSMESANEGGPVRA